MFVAKRSSRWKFKFKRLLNPGSLCGAEQNGKKKVCAMHLKPATRQQCPVAGWSVRREVFFSEVELKRDSWSVGGKKYLKVVVCDVAMQNL